MQPSNGDASLSRAAQISRHEIRALIAALRDVGLWSPQLDGPFPDSAAVENLIEPVLADPARLAAVRDTGRSVGRDPELDRMAMLAALALGTPFGAVTMIFDDCQTLAGGYLGGAPISDCTPLEQSLCKFAVASGEPFFVEDARLNPLTVDNPLVRDGQVAAYAGVPLLDDGNQAVGALACWDTKPRFWTSGHVQVLTELGGVVRKKIFND